MARKRYTAEEIICHLRTVEIEAGKGLGIADACRKLGITEQTYYRWKKEYGGLRVKQAKRLKGLEQENARLKRLVADLSLDNSMLALRPGEWVMFTYFPIGSSMNVRAIIPHLT